MTCMYCYEKDKVLRYNLDSMKIRNDITDFIVRLAEKPSVDNNISVNYHGGEPLLKFKDVVEYF